MKKKLIFVFSLLFIFSCTADLDEFNYKEQNKRFSYTSVDKFKKSIINHFNDDSNKFDKSKINNIEDKSQTLDHLDEIIVNNQHEEFISNNPNKIFNLIHHLLLNDYSDQIIFESMQAYLRYLTREKILK